MSKVRMDDSLKESMQKFIKNSDKWNKQSEFVNQAVREKLKTEKQRLDNLTEEELKLLKKLADKELD